MRYIVKCLGEMQGSHDQMNLNQQTIAYCLIYGLKIDIGGIIFSYLIHKLQNGKKHRESNICYTRFLSLVFEKLLGDKYISNDLTLIKPHTITAASFQKLLASEVPLTSHMLKVAKLSEGPEQSLIPPSGEVNADDTADKSPSRTTMQLVTQPKAPTDRMTKKRRIPPSSKPKSPYKVRVILPKKQVTETQHAEVTVATADATKSLASESAEEQGNQPSTAEAEKKDDEFVSMEEVDEEQSKEIPTVEQLLDEIMHDSDESADVQEDSDYELMPEDDLRSVLGFENTDSDNTQRNDVSHSDHIFQDDNASAERLSLLDHLDHICE
ncbi:hypothetical protein Tco_1261961 [Tanacetum coccineum]